MWLGVFEVGPSAPSLLLPNTEPQNSLSVTAVPPAKNSTPARELNCTTCTCSEAQPPTTIGCAGPQSYPFIAFHSCSSYYSNSSIQVDPARHSPLVNSHLMASQQNGTGYQPPQMSRPKRPPTGDEEASQTLRLGEFQDVPSLSLSEARYVINAVTTSRRESGKKPADSETLLKVQEYLEMFSRYKEQEPVQTLEQLFNQTNLDKFERSQLGMLCSRVHVLRMCMEC